MLKFKEKPLLDAPVIVKIFLAHISKKMLDQRAGGNRCRFRA
jgi:hypothetical protein